MPFKDKNLDKKLNMKVRIKKVIKKNKPQFITNIKTASFVKRKMEKYRII